MKRVAPRPFVWAYIVLGRLAAWLGNLEKNHGRQIMTEYGDSTPASKRWFMTTFGNNGYTREFAYLDQDDVIRRQAEQEAEEMMKLLLQCLPATP